MAPQELIHLIDAYTAAKAAFVANRVPSHHNPLYDALHDAREALNAALPTIRQAVEAWAWLERTGITVFETADGVWSCFAEKLDPETIGPTPLAAVVSAMGKEQFQPQPEVRNGEVD